VRMGDRDLVTLVSALVAIESVNPAFAGGQRGETAVAEFVADHCRRLGLDVERQPVLPAEGKTPARENVLAELSVSGARRTLLFEAHMDTVALDASGSLRDGGLTAETRAGHLYGRGTCDTKGALAAMLAALETLLARRRELGVNVVLAATVDEEHRFRGVLALLESGRTFDAGVARTRISTVGRAAHSSRPDEGINAIERMVPVIAALGDLRHRLALRRHPLVGSPTLSIGRIWGGTAVSVVPDRCTVEIDRRVIPGETADGALTEIDEALAAARRDLPDLEYEREAPFVADWPLDTPQDAAVVLAARAAARTLALPDSPTGVPYGSDASKLQALGGVPSIVLGPGSIAQAHTAEEFVPIDHLSRAAELYARTALNLAALLPPSGSADR
jgi:acetylornithine deacetylase/succinyl-diaminopimelate desuccinylase-like protein